LPSGRLPDTQSDSSFYLFNPVEELANLMQNVLTSANIVSLWIVKHNINEHTLDLLTKSTELSSDFIFSACFNCESGDIVSKDGGRGSF
jgi:hypothetical protein